MTLSPRQGQGGAEPGGISDQNSSPALNTVQRWMLSVITHPGGVTAGVHSDAAREMLAVTVEQLGQVVVQSPEFTSVERLAVYGNAYFARLAECLEAEFPAVRHAVGKDAFRAFAFGYLQEFPSTSYTLNLLGRNFPAYLRQSCPPSDPGEAACWSELVIELAELERIYMDVFDGPGEERQPPFSPAAIHAVPAERWSNLRLRTSASLRLCQFQFPVHEYISAVRRNTVLPFCVPETIWLVVHRRDYIVRREAVSEVQWRLLSGLQQNRTLGIAIEVALKSVANPGLDMARELGSWFEQWTAAGYFCDVSAGQSATD